MTRRREVPVLAFTPSEAAQAIRLSEHTMRLWIKEGIVRHVRWNRDVFVPRRELDRLIDEAMNNGGTLPAFASTSDSHVPAGVNESGVDGAAGPVDRRVPGKARTDTTSAPAPSGLVRPAAPTTRRRPAVRAAGLQDNAG